jgi:hypothetical protein
MKWILSFLLLLAALGAQAQDCVNNSDSSGNVCTAFTLGAPTANCIPVLTQDGQPAPQGYGAVCPLGFFGGSGMQITLPSDPVNPGNSLTSYICSTAVLSNTVPIFSKTPQPPGSLVQSLTCTVEYGWFTATWAGTLEYDYSSVHATRCSGGRGGGCHTGYFPVATGGEGEIATAPPPPPPPPPPQPTVIDATIAPSSCDATWVCSLVPVDGTVIAGAVFAINDMALQVNNADGTVDVYALDYANVAPANEDGTLFIVSGGGSIYDAGGNLVKTVSVVVNVSVDEDTGLASVTGGTLEVTIPPPP